MHRLRLAIVNAVSVSGCVILMICVSEAQAASSLQTPSSAVQLSAPISGQANDGRSLPYEVQGDLLMNHGSYAAALEMYQKAWPRSAQLWNKTGLAYHHLFALDEALKDYEMALTLDPHYSEAYNNLGAVYHGKNEFGLAERQYKRAIKYQPKAAVSYCNLGTTYFAEHKYKQGVRAYRKAVEIDPNAFNTGQRDRIEEGSSREARVETAYNLAKVYAGSGRNNEALAALRRALMAGFKDRKRLMNEKEFASLRETPEFHQLLIEEHLE